MGLPRVNGAARGWLARALVCGALATPGCFAQDAADVAVSAHALRPDAPGPDDPPPAFEPDDHVEQFDSAGGEFRVHFTRAGVHAVPAQDADASGIPDYVELVAAEYDAIFAFYRDTLGFAPPLSDDILPRDNGGDGRFDVYLLDFATTADGHFQSDGCLRDAPARCSGYMLQENDFDGRRYSSRAQAVRIVASHELFHAVQAGYRAAGSVVLSEASAVWASETYDPELRDFEGFTAGYLERPERSLGQEPSGPVDPFSYGSALFLRYLEERFDRDVMRELWEALASDASDESWLDVLDGLLATRDGTLGDSFVQFARWNLYTAARADAAVAYREGASYPAVTAQPIALPFEDDSVRVFPLAARYYQAPLAAGTQTGVALATRDVAQLAELVLVVALERDSRIVELQQAPATAGPLMLPVASEEGTLHVVVINPRIRGESARPAVCIGSVTELEGCARRHGAGRTDAPPQSTTAPKDDAGCRIASHIAPTARLADLAFAFFILLHRRRRYASVIPQERSGRSSGRCACRPQRSGAAPARPAG